VFRFSVPALALRDFDFDFLGTIVREESFVAKRVHEVFASEIVLVQKPCPD